MLAASTHIAPTIELIERRNGSPVNEPVTLGIGLLHWWASSYALIDLDGDGGDLADTYDPSITEILLTANNGAVTAQGGFKKWLSCMRFNGASFQYFSSPDLPELRIGNENATFSAWVFLETVARQQVIVSKRSFDGFDYELGFAPGSGFYWSLNLFGRYFEVATQQSPPVNTWILLTWGFNRDAQRVFVTVNAGAPIERAVFTTVSINPTPGEFEIGKSYNPGVPHLLVDFPLTGRVEQLCRWNRVLTKKERDALLAASLLDTLAAGAMFTPATGADYPGAVSTYATPAAPSNLIAVVDGSAVDLTWICNAPNEAEIQIERSINGGAFELIARLLGGSTEYEDTSADPGVDTLLYRVRSLNILGDTSAYSDTAAAGLGLDFSSSDNSFHTAFL